MAAQSQPRLEKVCAAVELRGHVSPSHEPAQAGHEYPVRGITIRASSQTAANTDMNSSFANPIKNPDPLFLPCSSALIRGAHWNDATYKGMHFNFECKIERKTSTIFRGNSQSHRHRIGNAHKTAASSHKPALKKPEPVAASQLPVMRGTSVRKLIDDSVPQTAGDAHKEWTRFLVSSLEKQYGLPTPSQKGRC